MIMKANYEDKIPQKTSEVNLGNLYDINKQIMLQTDAMSKEKQIAQQPTPYLLMRHLFALNLSQPKELLSV